MWQFFVLFLLELTLLEIKLLRYHSYRSSRRHIPEDGNAENMLRL